MMDTQHPKEIAKYKIERHLGSGQFGAVYLAHDRVLDARKAIKILNVARPELFMQKFEEAQILNKCKHKHIVLVNEANAFNINGELKAVIDMEYIEGGSLESAINSSFFPLVSGLRVIIGILFALEYTHNQNIIHRDIKPANIMIDNNIAKLSDFGLATSVTDGVPGSPQGYTTHLPPEYFTSRTTTVLTDIFATGITLFRLICNVTGWRARLESVPNIGQKILNGTVVRSIGYPHYVPSKLKRIINKACHPNSGLRFQNAIEMRQALERLVPAIDWKCVSDNSWQGECCNTGALHEVLMIRGRRDFKVAIKKNGRRNRSDEIFSDEMAAHTFINEQIQNTTFK
jgi:serine/threonine-protein kinase